MKLEYREIDKWIGSKKEFIEVIKILESISSYSSSAKELLERIKSCKIELEDIEYYIEQINKYNVINVKKNNFYVGLNFQRN